MLMEDSRDISCKLFVICYERLDAGSPPVRYVALFSNTLTRTTAAGGLILTLAHFVSTSAQKEAPTRNITMLIT